MTSRVRRSSRPSITVAAATGGAIAINGNQFTIQDSNGATVSYDLTTSASATNWAREEFTLAGAAITAPMQLVATPQENSLQVFHEGFGKTLAAGDEYTYDNGANQINLTAAVQARTLDGDVIEVSFAVA